MIDRAKHRCKALWINFPNAKRLEITTGQHTAEVRRKYIALAHEFVRARVAAGWKCPVVSMVIELANGQKYGWPISDKLTEVHHMRGRAGSLLLDQRYWLAVSKQGHRWIHSNIEKARALGWLCELGKWNVPT